PWATAGSATLTTVVSAAIAISASFFKTVLTFLLQSLGRRSPRKDSLRCQSPIVHSVDFTMKLTTQCFGRNAREISPRPLSFGGVVVRHACGGPAVRPSGGGAMNTS